MGAGRRESGGGSPDSTLDHLPTRSSSFHTSSWRLAGSSSRSKALSSVRVLTPGHHLTDRRAVCPLREFWQHTRVHTPPRCAARGRSPVRSTPCGSPRRLSDVARHHHAAPATGDTHPRRCALRAGDRRRRIGCARTLAVVGCRRRRGTPRRSRHAARRRNADHPLLGRLERRRACLPPRWPAAIDVRRHRCLPRPLVAARLRHRPRHDRRLRVHVADDAPLAKSAALRPAVQRHRAAVPDSLSAVEDPGAAARRRVRARSRFRVSRSHGTDQAPPRATRARPRVARRRRHRPRADQRRAPTRQELRP